MNRNESDQAAAAASIEQDPVTVKPIGGEYGFPGWHTVLLGGKALRHFAQQDAADRYAEGVRVGRDSVEGADPGLTARMATALTGALNYIEHSHANRGKATSDAEWDANVAAFRKQGVSQLGIGRSYTDKAQVDLAMCREVLAEYGSPKLATAGDAIKRYGPAVVADPPIRVATVGGSGFDATWCISQNLTDRDGAINDHEAERKPLVELQATPGLLDRLRGQMDPLGDDSFIVRKDGKFGVLFEHEYVSSDSDDDSNLPSYEQRVAQLRRQAAELAVAFPDVEFAVPEAEQVFNGRPAIWAFVADGALTAERIESLSQQMRRYAFPEIEPEGMKP